MIRDLMMLAVLLGVVLGPYLLLSLVSRSSTGLDFGQSVPVKTGLSLLFLFTASGHFILAAEMAEMLPPWIVFRLQIVYLTGILEVLGAVGIWMRPFEKLAGRCLILMLIAFLPVNIYAAFQYIDFGGHQYGPFYLLIRIPFQLFLIWWIHRNLLRNR